MFCKTDRHCMSLVSTRSKHQFSTLVMHFIACTSLHLEAWCDRLLVPHDDLGQHIQLKVAKNISVLKMVLAMRCSVDPVSLAHLHWHTIATTNGNCKLVSCNTTHLQPFCHKHWSKSGALYVVPVLVYESICLLTFWQAGFGCVSPRHSLEYMNTWCSGLEDGLDLILLSLRPM